MTAKPGSLSNPATSTAMLTRCSDWPTIRSCVVRWVPQAGDGPETVSRRKKNESNFFVSLGCLKEFRRDRMGPMLRKPRGFAGVHRSRMTDRVGNVGVVFVEEAYRGRGVAKALVSAVAAGLLAAGRVPMYGCSADNQVSAGIAQAVGFLLRGYRCRVTISRDQTEGHEGA